MTTRALPESCPHVFKGKDCGYYGHATWCDKTAARCKEIGRKGGADWVLPRRK